MKRAFPNSYGIRSGSNYQENVEVSRKGFTFFLKLRPRTYGGVYLLAVGLAEAGGSGSFSPPINC